MNYEPSRLVNKYRDRLIAGGYKPYRHFTGSVAVLISPQLNHVMWMLEDMIGWDFSISGTMRTRRGVGYASSRECCGHTGSILWTTSACTLLEMIHYDERLSTRTTYVLLNYLTWLKI